MRQRRFLIPLLAFGSLLAAQDRSLEDLKKAVVATGRLEFRRDVPIRYLNREQLQSYIWEIFEKDYPAQMASQEEEFLLRMGYVEQRLDLKSLRRQILLENAGGLYNDKTGELIAVEEFRQIDLVNSMAMVHELRHAIQDQHFGLSRLLGEHSDFDDRRLAVLAAIEGDATLIMIKQLGFDPDFFLQAFQTENLLSLATTFGQASLSRSPGIVQDQLLMPYREGLAFVQAIFKKKSWRGLNRILAAPPRSSAQILHPEKYLAGETPLEVAIRYAPAGFSPFHSGVIGEYYLNVLLRPSSGGAPAGTAAPAAAGPAQGWRGDRFTIFKKAGSEASVLAWKSVWSSSAEASRFAAAFRAFLERRFAVSFCQSQRGTLPFAAGESAAGYFLLRQDRDMLFYVRASERRAANDLIAAAPLE